MPNPDEEAGPGGRFTSAFRRRRGLRNRRAAVAVAVLLALVLVGGWFWLRSRPDSLPDARGPQDRGAASPAPSDQSGIGAPDTTGASGIGLPELDASDEFVRQMMASLSSRPGWLTWLATEGLVRRFVRAVIAVSAGESPVEHVGFLRPEERFRVRESGDSLFVHPASYRRYDLATAIFVSLDTQGTTRAYRRLRPLFQEAYEELGFRRGSFDGTLALAIDHLLAVPVPEDPVAIERTDSLYVHRDPALEESTAAQKQLLLLGPENARRVQAKLRELAGALELVPRGGR